MRSPARLFENQRYAVPTEKLSGKIFACLKRETMVWNRLGQGLQVLSIRIRCLPENPLALAMGSVNKAVSRMFPFSHIRIIELVVEELSNASIEGILHYDLPPTIVPLALPFSFHPLNGEFLALDLN